MEIRARPKLVPNLISKLKLSILTLRSGFLVYLHVHWMGKFVSELAGKSDGRTLRHTAVSTKVVPQKR